MKSLSLLIFLGTSLALLVGGIFAVSPALAGTPAQEQSIAVNLPARPVVREPLAPLTGASAADQLGAAPATAGMQLAAEVEAPAAIVASFTTNLAKAISVQADIAAPLAEGDIAAAPAALDLSSFASSLANGKASQVTGIFVKDVMAYSVGSQPGGNAGYVTEQPGQVTRFSLAAQYGSQGFLAHNYLAGSAFFSLSEGQTITLVHGDGSTHDYRITSIRRFQALSPNSTQSRFVDLDSGKELSATSLFNQIYNSSNPVVLQTCIEKDGISTWGRVFIMAVPINS